MTHVAKAKLVLANVDNIIVVEKPLTQATHKRYYKVYVKLFDVTDNVAYFTNKLLDKNDCISLSTKSTDINKLLQEYLITISRSFKTPIDIPNHYPVL